MAIVGLAALAAVAAFLVFMVDDAEAQPPPLPPPASAPSNCNYNINNNFPYNWEEIQVTGTSMSGWTADTSSDWITPTPFFEFYLCGAYGHDYLLSSKGHICLGTAPTVPPACGWCCGAPGGLPNTGGARPAVWGYYADLHPGMCPPTNSGASCIYWQVLGIAPNRRLIYEFKSVPYWAGTGVTSTFQIKLFETTACMEVHYQSVGGNSGNYATAAGYNGPAGTTGWQYNFDSAQGFPAALSAWQACPSTPPPPPPPSCSPLTQTVLIGQTANLAASGGTPPYTWTATGGTPASGAGSAFSTSYATSGTYTVTVTDSVPGSSNCTVNVPAPSCSPATQTRVTGQAATFTATGGTGTYSWSAPGGSPASGSGSPFSTTYSSAGTFTVTLTSGSQSVNCTVTVNLPACGYVVTSPAPYNFVDITATGTGLAHTSTSAINVPIPFTFNFCGAAYTTVRTSSEGYVCLGPTASLCTDSTPTTMPSTFNPRPAIYGYYTNLYPPGCPGGAANCNKWEVQGTAPNRVFIYMQKGLNQCCTNGPGPISYEIKLFEGSDCAEVHYENVQPTNNIYRAQGGFQNAAGTLSYTYADATPGFLRSNTAVRYCPNYGVLPDAFTLNEDAPATAFNVLANDGPGGSVQSVTAGACIAQASCPTTLGTVSVTAGSGSITYAPALDKNGVDVFSYTRLNGTQTGTTTVTMTVNAVNDAPAFVGGPALVAAQGTPMQTFPGWATAVVPAPATATDETGQSITFLPAGNSNPAIFDVAPTLERTTTAASTVANPPSGSFGVLRFTPSATTYGTSQVCFTAQDSGLTANGGVDTSAPQCATITVDSCDPQDDLYLAYRWWPLARAAPGVGSNDVGSPREPIALVATTANGQLQLETTGAFTYYADEDFLGFDTFQYTIQCGANTSRVVTATIEVRVNQPPVAYFTQGTPDAMPGQGITFNSCPGAVPECSYDAEDGSNLAYFWEFGDGATSQLPLPSHAFAATGSYLVRLTVRDSVGNTSFYERTIVVAWPDAAPVASDGGAAASPLAEAGPDRTVSAGTLVVLDGSQPGGADPTAVYVWEQVRGTPVELRDRNTPNPSFVAPAAPDDLMFRLHILVGPRVSAGDYVTIHVVPNRSAPEAHAGGTVQARTEATVTLDGSASSDPDGDPLTYQWTQVLRPGDVVVELDDTSSPTLSFTAPDAAAVLLFELRVSDGVGMGLDQAMVVVQPPIAAAVPSTPDAAALDVRQEASADAGGGAGWLPWAVGGGLVALSGAGLVLWLRRRS